MTIAVHISAGRDGSLSDNFNFICFSELAAARPDSHFIFIFDTPPHPELYLEANCTPVILSPSLKNNLLRHYWYNYKLPAIIQKYNAEFLITAGLTCSFKLDIPQCLVVTSRDISLAGRSLYMKRFVSSFFKKASCIFTTDQKAFETLHKKYALAAKATLLFPGLNNEEGQASYEEREATKNEYSGGHEYFLYPATGFSFDRLKIVLKAFSIFKKWQKSSMRMVLLVNVEFEKSISKELALYKYRGDLMICNPADNGRRLMKSAYAILLDSPDIFTTALPSMKSGVPVIVKEDHHTKHILQGAVHTTWQEKDISEKMMSLYKDEHRRSEVIHAGLETTSKYSWKNTAEKIWQTLQDLPDS